MNEGLTALKENFAASDKYVILLNDMLSRDTVSKAAFFTSETLRWAAVAQSYLKKLRLPAAAMTWVPHPR